ncbi:MAG TPA: DUF938 domain-containing protein [Rhizobiales bacterium]|nr:DUF938 domain-containing protein [Hyphomicrobiales bacterium]
MVYPVTLLTTNGPENMTAKQDAPAFHRNKQPMLDVLVPLLAGEQKHVLEIASGSGQHGPFFTDAMDNLVWWPSDINAEAINSINAWRRELDADAVQNPQLVDVTADQWRTGESFTGWPEKFDAIVSMNMIHIAPGAATPGLIEGAAKRLNSNGKLIFYGPFKRNGKQTADSNEKFDQWLKSRDADWGVRDLEDVTETAKSNGLTHYKTIEMPANNLVVVFRM